MTRLEKAQKAYVRACKRYENALTLELYNATEYDCDYEGQADLVKAIKVVAQTNWELRCAKSESTMS